MMLTPEIKKYVDQSVLCWLATASKDNLPNVSPKEIFTYYGPDRIIVANIASPQTVKNIQQNSNVCISFIDVLVQKGSQIKGTAEIIKETDPEFKEMEKVLLKMTGGKFPFASITAVSVNSVKPIIAPRYVLYPDTTVEQQIERARKSYNL
ncbi:pyridoxamine 5'-phosphate oxidase family protein [Fulvivirga sp. M361]|uniref:pyridoxamine 5'-phosphate oxidase family protein n=1 Tax=Fulvivirga sp. M361 TaxID=2594266 RepID=UPI00117A174A|nr:pyridoxamine 5'-phosphate oxidase family protein [Fulvivirga sp. M361]TRX62580.1 pyridoxamine 5'-phosphate oxidase family protein [Fulvivirga sp. M361]